MSAVRMFIHNLSELCDKIMDNILIWIIGVPFLFFFLLVTFGLFIGIDPKIGRGSTKN